MLEAALPEMHHSLSPARSVIMPPSTYTPLPPAAPVNLVQLIATNAISMDQVPAIPPNVSLDTFRPLATRTALFASMDALLVQQLT